MHLGKYRDVTGSLMPQSVGELGPGATLGTCIAALLDGAEEAIAFDAGTYASLESSLGMYDQLAEQSDGRVAGALADIRQRIAESGVPGRRRILRYVAPWDDVTVCEPASLDLIFSHSVMEHVNDPSAVYAACHYWLRPNGVMSHRIDHSSHGITRSWNGHYSIGPVLWRIIVGRRPYLLNRKTPREHLVAIWAAGFEVLPQTRFLCVAPDGRASERGELPANDLSVRTSTILARKSA